MNKLEELTKNFNLALKEDNSKDIKMYFRKLLKYKNKPEFDDIKLAYKIYIISKGEYLTLE